MTFRLGGGRSILLSYRGGEALACASGQLPAWDWWSRWYLPTCCKLLKYCPLRRPPLRPFPRFFPRGARVAKGYVRCPLVGSPPIVRLTVPLSQPWPRSRWPSASTRSPDSVAGTPAGEAAPLSPLSPASAPHPRSLPAYPVSSAGEPPPAPCDGGQDLSERDQAAIREEHRRLLCVRDAAARMRARLERHLDIELARPGTRRANLLFTAPTWLFTAGDEAIPLRIARALAKRDSPEFLRLGLDNPYSEWGACSGVGRGLYSAAAIEEAWNLLRTSPPSRPIFRAAAFGHPLARQPAATRVLCADPLLRDWILAEVHEGLAFLVRKRNRSFSKPGSVSLYARYLFLAVRALLRMKDDCPDPFQTISPAQSQIVELLTQIEATHHQRAWLQTPWAQEFELPLLQRTVRLCRGEEAPVDIPGAP